MPIDLDRRTAKRRIAARWVQSIELSDAEMHRRIDTLCKQMMTFCEHPDPPIKLDPLSEDAFFIELGQSFLTNLIMMRRDALWYSALPPAHRNEDAVREVASSMLRRLSGVVWRADRDLQLGLTTEPLDRLWRALVDLENGYNNRLVVTGEFAEKLHRQSFSERSRRIIHARAAAITDLLLSERCESSQMGAAKRVASALQRGGYDSRGARGGTVPVRPDTVKRWHNKAKRLMGDCSNDSCPADVPVGGREFLEHFRFKLAFFEPEAVERRRRSMFPKLAAFDPEQELADLEKLCRDLRTSD